MQHFFVIVVAFTLSLAQYPGRVYSRTPRDGVDPAELEILADVELSTTRRTSSQLEDLDELENPSIVSPVQENHETEGVTGCSHNSYLQGCKKDKVEAELNQDDHRRIRIEVIKQKILQKLRLKTPPQARHRRHGLPSLLLSNSEVLTQDADPTERSSELSESASFSRRMSQRLTSTPPDDDFYGTTKNVFVFPDNTSTTQIQCSQGTSFCLVFRLPQEANNGNLASSHLWLYKETVSSSLLGSPVISNQTLVVSELVYDRQFGILRKRILSLEDDHFGLSSGGWLRLRVDRAIRRWITKPHLLHALEVSCKGCGQFPVPVSQDGDRQPFLVLTVGPQPALSRRRRQVDCTDNTLRCCRETFYVNFTEIGWNEWIIQPPGYTANYCRGTCLNDVSTSRYHHTTVMNKFLQNQRGSNEPLFSLCCTPSSMSPISLIYLDDDGNLFQKSLPNMVVEACDCA